ncbi:MAG: hypothetical protein AB7D39_12170 [Pseudodesulfovibrio sp.]|uniref:hypothetical protein n=1 Tax=Pseudodesulfovibrio sp. TaxID=2035812 RepID=UPI003D0E245B
MRRFIFIIMTLFVLGFTASAWAGPGDHRQSGPQYSQQHQTRQSFQHAPGSGNHGQQMMGQRSMRDTQHWNQHQNQHHQWNHHPQQRFHRDDHREVTRDVHTTYQSTTSFQGAYQSLGTGQQLSVQIETTE